MDKQGEQALYYVLTLALIIIHIEVMKLDITPNLVDNLYVVNIDVKGD
ncbi:hypothetical protein [Pontibacillus yanchengensis]|nr:hypothetical protein [Pontibacillus yanchengensis]